jgi:tripartite-type tricarboxylate transporter receptor subunit TctC
MRSLSRFGTKRTRAMRVYRIMVAALAFLTVIAARPAAAQSYPDKPIKIVVAVAAGGPMDTMARAVAQQMQARLGQSVVVENRTGAGTTIGAKSVVAADPDGYTLLWGTLSMLAIAPVLYPNLDFDPTTLVPVALVAEFPSLVVIPPNLPATTMAEFIAYARANRGKLNYGGSLGTPPQLMGATLNKVADLGMTYVPYRGGAPSIP